MTIYTIFGGSLFEPRFNILKHFVESTVRRLIFLNQSDDVLSEPRTTNDGSAGDALSAYFQFCFLSQNEIVIANYKL